MESWFRNIEPSFISKNVIYDAEPLYKDGRMFNNYPLYCEGAHKPVCRGFFHLAAVFMFPLLFWRFYQLTREAEPAVFYLAMFCVLTGFLTVLVSALYHIVEWTVPQEIAINRLDHLMLIVFTMSIFYPVLLLVLPRWIGWPFCAIITGLTAWNLYGTMYGPPSLFRMMSVPFSQVPTFYHYYQLLTGFEWYAFWTSGIAQILGVLGFVNEYSPFDQNVFGFHELYHISTIVSIVAAYAMNYSIFDLAVRK